MVQTSFGFNGRFWPIKRPLFHGSRRPQRVGFSVVMGVSEPTPSTAASIALDRRVAYPKRAQCADSGRSGDDYRSAQVDPQRPFGRLELLVGGLFRV